MNGYRSSPCAAMSAHLAVHREVGRLNPSENDFLEMAT